MDGIYDLIASTRLKVLAPTYTVVGIPAKQLKAVKWRLSRLDGYASILFDGELTLLLPEKQWERISRKFRRASVEKGYKLILLDLKLEWSVVGYLAAISSALAEEGISVGVISAYSKDLILVKKSRVKKAVSVLRTLIKRAKDARKGV